MQISAATIAPCCGCGVAVPKGTAYCEACMDGLCDAMAEELAADYGPRGRAECREASA